MPLHWGSPVIELHTGANVTQLGEDQAWIYHRGTPPFDLPYRNCCYPVLLATITARREDHHGAADVQLIWPWQDRTRGFSWLKAGTLALIFAPGLWLAYQVATEQFGPVPLGGMTYWSGLSATGLLILALAITPLTTITGWARLIIVRRMIGVSALVYTIVHVFIYFALRFWNFASIAHEMSTRLSLILATIATLGLIALGTTSLDAAIRRLGPKGWQQLHNAIYVIAALALIHYLLSPDIYPEQYLVSGLFCWLMLWRGLSRRGLERKPAALAVIAVVSAVFTGLLEAGWIWAYHGYTFSEIRSIYFSLELGIPPAWKILVVGLLAAATAAVQQLVRLRTAGPNARKIPFL
jgi:methionine sulfoxide reductase heme-binding subunit